jgi:hypothetical protein
MNQQLCCRFCGKPVKSKSGLTLHEKTCPRRTDEPEDDQTQNPYGADELEPELDFEPEPERRSSSHDRTVERHEKANGKTPFSFQIGAFLVMADYIPILLDVDFCIALGHHILEHGSSNKAIMAFAHQLNKLDGE